MHGAREGKSPTPVFDPGFYLRLVDNDPKALADPLAHYLTFGITEDKPPCSWFDPRYYREKYSARLAGLYPFEHYLSNGVYEGLYVSDLVETLPHKPVISLIVPVYNVDASLLNNCINSVLYQSYPHWEICLADDGSTRSGLTEQLEAWGRRDSRIKVIFSKSNRGISAASNAAAEKATGEFLGFLDNDDELASDCLYEIVKTINTTQADLLYTDEELIGDDGRRFTSFRKPVFNEELLLSHNYVTHFVAVSRDLFNSISGFRSELDGAQDFDLMLRLSRVAEKITHIPKILYRWRTTPTSTSINHNQKTYAQEAGKKALQDFLNSINPKAVVTGTDTNYFYRIKYPLREEPVTVLIWCEPTTGIADHYDQLKQNTDYGNCQFWLIYADSDKPELPANSYEKEPLTERVFRMRIPPGTSRARAMDLAVQLVDSDYLVFLDDSIKAVEQDWLKELIARFQATGVLAVCGRVSSNDGDGPSYTIPDLSNSSPYYFMSFITLSSRHANGIHCPQTLMFCPWDVCALRKKDYVRLGGFAYDEFPALFAMTDLALRAEQAGHTVVYTPYSRLLCSDYNFENRMVEDTELETEMQRFKIKYHDTLMNIDAFYNPGLLEQHEINRDVFRHWLTGQNKPVMP
jgi:glycosyltransferase involved in cell wall biosynthesis